MERIKQALEKAREDRMRSGALNVLSPQRVVSPTSPIAYSETRTVDVPAAVLRERRVISAVEAGAFTDSYRILRTQILQRLREKRCNSLAVTSANPNEGKTLTAINLAISLAKEVNYTVLLVDADLRHPSVHTYFEFAAERGLSDYLTNDLPLKDLLIHPTGLGDLVILPGGRPLPNSSEMLNSPKMARLVDELKARYPSRIVLFDLPPVLTTADALAFAPYVDAALLVIEEGRTSADDARRAIELLHKTEVLGTILNKSNDLPSRAGTSDVWADKLVEFGERVGRGGFMRSLARRFDAWKLRRSERKT